MKIPALILTALVMFTTASAFAGSGDGDGSGGGKGKAGAASGAKKDTSLAEAMNKDFNTIDANKDGQISRKELKAALAKKGPRKPEKYEE